MSELTDDRLRDISQSARANFEVTPYLDFNEVRSMCRELLALRAAASTSTEAVGLDDLARAIAASHGVIFEELEEHGDDGENKTTYRRLAAKRVRALTPPTPKVTT